MLTCWGNPERVVRVAIRYVAVLVTLGQAGSAEHKYHLTLHEKGLNHIGDQARHKWTKRPFLRRLLEFRSRREWEAAHTQSLFDEAEADLHRVRDSVADFRARVSRRDHIEAGRDGDRDRL